MASAFRIRTIWALTRSKWPYNTRAQTSAHDWPCQAMVGNGVNKGVVAIHTLNSTLYLFKALRMSHHPPPAHLPGLPCLCSVLRPLSLATILTFPRCLQRDPLLAPQAFFCTSARSILAVISLLTLPPADPSLPLPPSPLSSLPFSACAPHLHVGQVHPACAWPC